MDKYISKYSNGKYVSPAQYITEMICENKAKIDKKDLHYRFWLNKEWSAFFRNQIATANKLVKTYGDKAVIKALKNDKASRIYSLRSPVLLDIIKKEAFILSQQQPPMPKNYDRNIDISKRRNLRTSKNIRSKLEDIDNEC
jgi:hypothetical protein